MSGDAGSLYHIIDIVAKVKLENNATKLTVPFDGPGYYFIVPCPIITPEEVVASGENYVFSSGCFLYAETSNDLQKPQTSTFNSSGLLGYWGCDATFEDDTKKNVIYKPSSSTQVTMLGNHIYYVLRAKH